MPVRQLTAEEVFQSAQASLKARNIQAALADFNAARERGYSSAEVCAGKWQCWMLLGEFDEAWRESDRIDAQDEYDRHRCWDGSDWKGKRLMVRCLHGLGDTIQFSRYASLLRQTCQRLILQTHPQLVTLAAQVQGVDEAITWPLEQAADRSLWDVQMEVTELPRVFRTNLLTIPRSVPYIDIPDSRREWACRLMEGIPDRPRIGLSWRAGPWDVSRTIPVDEMALLTKTCPHALVNLQRDAAEDELQVLGDIFNLEKYSNDVLDTAALICELDVVVTVDTMTAHLAGALGKRTYILLPQTADWRWMLETDRTPWYPTARLFRQRKARDWGYPLAEVSKALMDLGKDSATASRG